MRAVTRLHAEYSHIEESETRADAGRGTEQYYNFSWKKIDQRADVLEKKADALEKLIEHNAASINALKENAEFIFQEIQDMKKDETIVKKASADHEKRISELEDKVNDAERYQRCWNLRLHGLPEQEGEDIKQQVEEICWAVAPGLENLLHLHIDVSHRVGRRSEDRIRPIITRLTSRATREMVWKNAKNADYLTSRKIRFGEDLTSRDKETRNKLWPHIEAARKEGKMAFFRGAKAKIDGKELRYEGWQQVREDLS